MQWQSISLFRLHKIFVVRLPHHWGSNFLLEELDMKIEAAVIYEKNGPFIFDELDLDDPMDDEVLVRNVASGICHTDTFGRTLGWPIPLPLVLGHEGAGIVEKVGSNVKNLKPGDHVCFSYAFCGHCNECLSDIPNYCEHFNDINFGGVSSHGGTRLHKDGKPVSMFFGQSSFATHSVVNMNTCIKVDPDVDLAYAAPIGCGLQTGAGTVLNIIRPRLSDTIAVFGCGAVGLAAVMGALIARCEKVIAVDISEKSLALAQELGAIPVNSRNKSGDEVVAEIKKICPHGVSYAINTTGVGDVILSALRSTKVHGTLITVAPSGVIKELNVGIDVLMHYRTIKGICEGDSVPGVFIPELLRMFKEGLFPIDKLVTTFPFHQIDNAFAAAGRTALKAVMRIPE